MPKITVSSEIAAPIDKVFSVFTDVEHAANQVSGIKEIKMLTPGGFGLGSRWLETREVLGRLDSAEMEVTSFEKHRTYTISHHKGGQHLGARVDAVFTFEPAGDGTKVTVEFDLEGPGLPPGLLAPLGWAIAGRVRDVLSHDLADLKHVAEK
ncbi:MAG: SRPBCC family protein [Acidobacteria bacterium]|nr:SRPBCC family protein [Acidobacteriota bacterium]